MGHGTDLMAEVGLVGAAGLEPATLGFEGRCSFQLNYAHAPLTQSGRVSGDRKPRYAA